MQTRAGAGNVAGSGHLERPPGSKVTTEELLREVEEYFAVGAKVTPGAIVLDVGSNIGAFSLRVSERCAGDVRLLCFEPSPATVGALRSNFATHPTLRHTRHSIHHVGLTSKENAQRELAFYDFRRFPTNSTFDLGGKRREFEIFFEDRGRRIGAHFVLQMVVEQAEQVEGGVVLAPPRSSSLHPLASYVHGYDSVCPRALDGE